MIYKFKPLVFICTYIIAGLFVSSSIAQIAPNNYEQLNLFGDAYERVKRSYVEEVSDEKLVKAAINGLLASLDPLSNFLTTDEFQYLNNFPLKKYEGLGIELTISQGVPQVVSALDNSPAESLGLLPGDLIIDVNRTPVYGMTLNQALEEIHGEAGTAIELLIVRKGQEPFTVSSTRETISKPTVSSRVRGIEGYLRIPLFTEETPLEIKAAINELSNKIGDDFGGLVIDLRNTPGGKIESGIEVADLFLSQGEITTVRGRNDVVSETFNSNSNDLLNGKPIVIITNRGTAGAAEIMVGALKDHDRAIIIGTKTFGLGSRQKIVPIGEAGFVQITVGHFYSPSGEKIDGQGITPGIEVVPSKVIVEEERFDRRREATLKGALDVPNEAQLIEEELLIDDDYQLSRALDLLHALVLLGQAD